MKTATLFIDNLYIHEYNRIISCIYNIPIKMKAFRSIFYESMNGSVFHILFRGIPLIEMKAGTTLL
jgi:hypothetical protein